MQTIRVSINSHTNVLTAKIGDVDVAEFVGRLRAIKLRTYIPAAHRSYMRPNQQRAFQVDYVMQRGVLEREVLVNAIKGYLTDHTNEALGQEHEVEAIQWGDVELAQRLASGLGQLLIGGRLFRLQLAEASDAPTRLLTRMRTTAAEAIRVERDRLMARAAEEAAIVRRQAAAERDEVERQRIQLRAERGSQVIIPSWLIGSDVPMIAKRGCLFLRQELTFAPREYVYLGFVAGNFEYHPVDLRWNALEAPALDVKFWLKIDLDGRYDLLDSYVDYDSPMLPHAAHYRICVQPGSMPEVIHSLNDLERVRMAIERAFRTVSLSSLLTNTSDWSDEVRVFCPPGVFEFMSHQGEYVSVNALRAAPVNATVTVPEPPSLVWTNERVR